MPEDDKEKAPSGPRQVKFNHKGKPLCEIVMDSQLALDIGFHYDKKYYKVSEVISQEECNVNQINEKTGMVIS